MLTNQYIVTKKLYMKWADADRRKGLSLKINILWAVVLVILIIATAIYMKLKSHVSGDVSMLLVLEGALLVFSVYKLFFSVKSSAAAMYDKFAAQLGHDWTRTMYFKNDALYVSEGQFEVNYPYKEIVSVRNIGNEILIETDKKLFIRAYKDSFIEGDYSRFKRFIESKVVNKCFLN